MSDLNSHIASRPVWALLFPIRVVSASADVQSGDLQSYQEANSKLRDMKPQKYLDLTALQAGDVLLTREYTFTSCAIVWAQRFWHFKLFGRGFSHATVVISPLLTFDTRGGSGARFRRLIATNISEDDRGRLQLWLSLSEYKDVALIRYGSKIDSKVLLKSAVAENTTPYPRINGFLSLFHPAIKSLWSRIARYQHQSGNESEQMFCSSLVAYLLKKVNAGEYFRKTDWSAISPFKLYDASYEKKAVVMTKTPADFSTSNLHLMLLLQAQLEAGANDFTDMNQFQHASEDLTKAVANSSPLIPLLRNHPEYFIDFDGKKISLFDKPHFAQLPYLVAQIDSNAEMLRRFESMCDCFALCKDSCVNAAGCYNDVLKQMAKFPVKDSDPK